MMVIIFSEILLLQYSDESCAKSMFFLGFFVPMVAP